MKAITLRFFSPTETSQAKQKKEKAPKPVKVVLTGYISATGKLFFPAKTAAGLGIDLENTAFRVGMEEGKRKAKSLYLVPVSEAQEDSFKVEKAARSFSLSIPFILAKSGVDYAKSKYTFTINQFDYEGATAFELQLSTTTDSAKVPYSGKPRGRKAKTTAVE